MNDARERSIACLLLRDAVKNTQTVQVLFMFVDGSLKHMTLASSSMEACRSASLRAAHICVYMYACTSPWSELAYSLYMYTFQRRQS